MSALNATYPSSNTTASTGGVAALYHRCGGINWDGPTECEAGSYCKEQNPFYFQCVAAEGAYTNATATGSNGELIRIPPRCPVKHPSTIAVVTNMHATKVDYINTLLASGPASARPTTLVTITASSSAAATPTSTADDDEDYCDDEQPVAASASSTPTPSAAVSEEDDYCEDEETATVTVSSRPTASAAAASEEDDYCEDEQ